MRNFLYASLSGALLALAWPTYGFPLLMFFAFVPLLYIEFNIRTTRQKNSGWKVFFLAYWSFFIWNIITTYWIYFSTEVGGVFAVLVNSLLMTLVVLIYHKIAKRLNFLAGVVFLATLWMSFEYLHLHWDFSWPWLNLGNAFSEYPQWIQWYEYTGTFGGTLWIWITNLMILKALLLFKQENDQSILYRAGLRLVLLIGIPIGVSYYMWSSYSMEDESTIEVLILQPNIDPYSEKYNTDDEQIGKLLKQMTDENITPKTQLVIAPETVFADGTDRSHFESSPAYQYGLQIIKEYPQTAFLGGVSFYELIRKPENIGIQTNFLRPGLWFNDYNSAYLLANEHHQIYDKSKLVVGVETFPFQSVLKPLLGDIMIDLGGTVAMKTTQPDRGVFEFDDNNLTGPIICYESVYGEFVNGYVENGAQFLSIITNDAWWGNTEGHRQHMSYARLRAIETRRDIARSANTGISAIINQKGEVFHETEYEKRTVVLGDIHLNEKITFYTKYGDYIARVSIFMAFFIFLYGAFGNIKQRKQASAN